MSTSFYSKNELTPFYGRANLYLMQTESIALNRAIAALTSLTALAEALKVSRATIYNWGRGKVPGEAAIEIERVTGGVVKRSELRPDLWKNVR